MALLDRVKERVETDLSDAELQRLIDEANQEIIRRHGPHADPAAPITVTMNPGGARVIDLIRPIDPASPVVVTETASWDISPVTLMSGDYLVKNGGRTLERIDYTWGYDSWDDIPRGVGWGHTVTVTYLPVDDGNQRQEVIIGLVQLAVERTGVKSRKSGDLDIEAADYATERERLLGSLAPRRGLFVR